MADPHLNLFYAYDHDDEFVENNLARAWVATMRLLSAATRARLEAGARWGVGPA